jgi:hypothetical protein
MVQRCIFCWHKRAKPPCLLCMQFLIGCAHLRKQPLFQCTCGTAFEKCMDAETSEISQAQLADILRLSTMLPSDDGVSCHCLCCNTFCCGPDHHCPLHPRAMLFYCRCWSYSRHLTWTMMKRSAGMILLPAYPSSRS